MASKTMAGRRQASQIAPALVDSSSVTGPDANEAGTSGGQAQTKPPSKVPLPARSRCTDDKSTVSAGSRAAVVCTACMGYGRSPSGQRYGTRDRCYQ